MSDERWLPIPGYEGRYEVSDQGLVRSLPRDSVDKRRRRPPIPGRVLRAWRQGSTGTGYWTVWLYRDGEPASWRIHRLVLLAFDREPLPDEHGRHLNGDVDDNRLVNLAWGSASDNGLDTVRNGRHRKASATHCHRGHPFDERNTQIVRPRDRRPTRVCRECKNSKRRALTADTPPTVGGRP